MHLNICTVWKNSTFKYRRTSTKPTRMASDAEIKDKTHILRTGYPTQPDIYTPEFSPLQVYCTLALGTRGQYRYYGALSYDTVQSGMCLRTSKGTVPSLTLNNFHSPCSTANTSSLAVTENVRPVQSQQQTASQYLRIHLSGLWLLLPLTPAANPI